MKKNLSIIITIVAVALGALLIIGYTSGFFGNIFTNVFQQKIKPGEVVLFFGDGCPHCKLVDDYITQNKIEEKVKFTKLEVPFGNKTSPQLVSNANALLKKAQFCGIKTDQVGIPFLWDGKTCIVGDQDIINFFKNAAGAK